MEELITEGTRFIVRDFTYDENAIAQARREVTELTAVQKEQQVSFYFLLLTKK